MSRIDEALRQASVDDAEARDLGGLTEPAVRRVDESSLDRYPREGHARFERPARSELLTTRPIAAPRTGGRKQLAPIDPALEGKLIVSREASPVAVEQYRRLAATLHSLHIERGLKTLIVTSAVPAEGKTLTVANLALTLSESYKRRVVLIDADLRRPSIHSVFGLPNVSGLSECLRSERAQLSLLEVSPTLSVLPAGQPDANPMAKLTSPRMRAMLEDAGSMFDWVLVDAPPVGLMPDANLLARLTEAVIFVIAAGSTPHTLVERCLDEIGRDFILGTVLNRVEPHTLATSDYYHRYYRPESPQK
jgi:protein-tyrosine kinase